MRITGWARWALVGAMGVGAFGTHAALADPVVGEASLEVAVGATVSVDVGFARGLQCDDLSVIRAELRAASPTSNRLLVTGLKRGVTQCRAGTLGPPTALIHITVR